MRARYYCKQKIKFYGNYNGFTLLELLIVLAIISIFLAVTYPRIKNFILYSGANPGIIKTKNVLNRLLRERYGALSNKIIYVKFDFKRNALEVFYKKAYKLKPLKNIKAYGVKYKGVNLYAIKITRPVSGSQGLKGSSLPDGSKKPVYIEISPSLPSYPYYIYFKDAGAGGITELYVNTYYDIVKLG